MNFCVNCGEKPSTLKTCSGCKAAKYCNAKCQRQNWKEHKGVCAAPPTPSPTCRYLRLDAKTTVVELNVPPEFEGSTSSEIEIFVCLDNSSSMGPTSFKAAKVIADGFRGKHTTLVAFSQTQTVVAEGTSFPKLIPFMNINYSFGASAAKYDIANGAIMFPQQGCTDIGSAVEVTVDRILASKSAAHKILLLITDGENTPGFRNPNEIIQAQAARLHGVPLSVILVGVTSASSTALGMVVKRLETVDVGFPPICFCENPSELEPYLSSIVIPEVLAARVKGGEFRVKGGAVCMRIDKPLSPVVRCSEKSCFIVEGDFLGEIEGVVSTEVFDDEAMVLEALHELVRQAKIIKVAGISTKSEKEAEMCASRLETFIKVVDAKFKKATINFAVPAHQRLRQFKEFQTGVLFLRTLRNEILGLRAKLSTSSKDQAAYLMGCDGKYAAEAYARSAKVASDVVMGASVRATWVHMEKALVKDLKDRGRLLCADSTKAEAIRARVMLKVSDASVVNELFDCLADLEGTMRPSLCTVLEKSIFEVVGSPSASYLSTDTAIGHLREFGIDLPTTCDYDFLVSIGMIGKPMCMKTRDATQLDPFAFKMEHVSFSDIDSASFMLALKTENVIPPPEGGKSPNGILVLVDPTCSRSSKIFLRSDIYKKIVSSMLCKDLYMYQGIMQVFAIYAKAFVYFCTPLDKAEEFDMMLEGTLRRIYLGKAYQCKECDFGPVDHFECDLLDYHQGQEVERGARIDNRCPMCHWFSPNIKEWPKWDGKIPARPELLQRKMGVGAKAEGKTAPTSAAIVHAVRTLYTVRLTMSEDMARQFVEATGYYASELVNPLMMCIAAGAFGAEVDAVRLVNEALAREVLGYVHMVNMNVQAYLFGLFEIEGPKPSMLLFDKVEEWCEPVLHSLDFAERLQTILKKRGGWAALEDDMIRGEWAWTDLVEEMKGEALTPNDLLTKLGLGDDDVRLAMVAQALLCGESSSRHDLPDVRDPKTLVDIKSRLNRQHTDKYYMELARVRRESERAERVARAQQPDGYLMAKQAAYDRANPEVKTLLDELGNIDHGLRFHVLKAMLQGISEKNATGLLDALDLL